LNNRIPRFTSTPKCGAIYSQSGNTIDLENCQFIDNFGGALYAAGQNVVDVNDCRFVGNEREDRSLTDYVGYLGSTASFTLVNGNCN